MTTRMRSIPTISVIVALLICLSTFLIDQTVSAHANLRESSPQPSEELDSAPERVIIWFTEPIEPAFSNIMVIAADGTNVSTGEPVFDPTEPTAMWVPLANLENGTYTVVWRNVSSVDGHKVTGSFLFAVGEPLGSTTPANVEEQPLLQSPADPIIRWIIYIGIAVFAGGLFFELVIATRIARAGDQYHNLSFAQRSSRRFATVALGAIVIVMLAQAAQLLLQTAIAYDVAVFAINPTQIIDVVTQSDWGRFWSWRLTAAVLAALALFVAYHSIQRTRRMLNPDEVEELPLSTETFFGIAAIALGGVYLLLISLTSHNAATPGDIRWFAIATDLVHIVSATIWVGGIAFLATASIHAIRSGNQSSRATFLQLAAGFSPLAIFATIILVASGIVSSLMQVTIPEALNTPYGRVLGAKVLLLVLLIGIAIKNNRTVTKSFSSEPANTRTLTRYITVELAIAFAVLLATAGLASLEPARQYAERNGIGIVDYISHTETVSSATIDVKLDPGNTGSNTLTVNITNHDGTPFLHADAVRGRIKYLDDDFGEYFFPLENPSPGEWHLGDITIGIAGAYQLDVTVVRSDAFDSHVSTRFSATSPTFASDLIRPSPQTAMSAFGVIIAIIGVIFLITTSIRTKPIRTDFKPYHSIAIITAFIGFAVMLNALTIGIGLPTEGKGNPYPLNQESVEIGRTAYTTTCATCHGDTGIGDGPAGLALNPPPADLAIHVPLHTDNELYSFIADGIEGTPMVAQLGSLTSDEIWHLVNYIRTISE